MKNEFTRPEPYEAPKVEELVLKYVESLMQTTESGSDDGQPLNGNQ